MLGISFSAHQAPHGDLGAVGFSRPLSWGVGPIAESASGGGFDEIPAGAAKVPALLPPVPGVSLSHASSPGAVKA